MWLSVTGLSEEPSRDEPLRGARGAGAQAVHRARPRLPADVLGHARRTPPSRSRRRSPHVTVAVGNREECEVAVGETEPERAADALLAAGVELAVVKQGPKGVLAKTRSGERVEAPPIPCGRSTVSAPETASAGRWSTGCSRAGRWRRSCSTRTRPAPSWPRAWSARRRCRPRPRSRRCSPGATRTNGWRTRWPRTSPGPPVTATMDAATTTGASASRFVATSPRSTRSGPASRSGSVSCSPAASAATCSGPTAS